MKLFPRLVLNKLISTQNTSRGPVIDEAAETFPPPTDLVRLTMIEEFKNTWMWYKLTHIEKYFVNLPKY